MTWRIRLAAVFGFLAVALGALGAHKLRVILATNGTMEIWEKAAHYHLAHAIVLLALAFWGRASRLAWWSMAGGILFFSGSLYIYALTVRVPLMYVTPVGGVLFLVGWGCLIFHSGKNQG